MTDYKETGLGAIYTAPNGDEFLIVMTKKGAIGAEPIKINLNFKNNTDSDAWRDILKKLQGKKESLPESVTLPSITIELSPFRMDAAFYTPGEFTTQQMNDLKKAIAKSNLSPETINTLGV